MKIHKLQMKKIYFVIAIVAISVLGTSCRPRQSAYRQVYEAAREREMQQQAGQPTVVRDADPLPPVEVSVRQERVDAVSPTDAAGLRRFNVVIASLSVRLNAESLKTRMQNEGHQVILAQNEQGMFRVIVGSFDDRASAVAQREQLHRRYSALGSPDFLRRTYGVPFNDLWILERQF
jgi:cell division septation protein DedD